MQLPLFISTNTPYTHICTVRVCVCELSIFWLLLLLLPLVIPFISLFTCLLSLRCSQWEKEKERKRVRFCCSYRFCSQMYSPSAVHTHTPHRIYIFRIIIIKTYYRPFSNTNTTCDHYTTHTYIQTKNDGKTFTSSFIRSAQYRWREKK